MELIIYIYLFILGSSIASFIHLYVTRTLNEESIVLPRSHCTNCNHMLNWYELIPVFSYLFQRGKCSKCNDKIGADSFICELILGLLYMLVYYVYGLSFNLVIGLVIATTLLSVCISDFKEMIILDSTIICSIVLVYIITFMDLGLRGIYKSFLYGVFAFVLMFLIKILGDSMFNRESLGGGDIKLAFLMGSILPYNLFLASMVLGSFIALPYALSLSNSKDSNGELPFGPFLLIGLFIVFLIKNDIMDLLDALTIAEMII